jgi:hypothetical protein
MSNKINKAEDINIESDQTEELNFYKLKSEELQNQLFKQETQNKKHELTIKKLQEMISVYGKVSEYKFYN